MEADVVTIMAIGSTAYALLSEVIGCSESAKSNSVVQLVMNILGKIFK